MPTDTFQPLAGIRVLDLSRVLAGPVCSMILADLGADVIKVERPGQGDDTRAWGPPFIEQPSDLAGMSAYFASVNRNKKSLSLDISRPDGRAVLLKLVERCDVVLENFLPANAAKLGLAPQDLCAIKPNLIVCSISGFGRTGPWSEQPGYDFVVQAMSGLMSITGEPDGEPMKVGVALTDVLTGLYAAVSVVAALRGRGATDRSPRFLHFDLALLDCTLASLVNVAQAFLVTGKRPTRYGNAHPQIVPYECFKTADGYIVLAVGNDDQFRRFCSASCPELGQDARFTTNPLRVTHRNELIPKLERLFLGDSTANWQRRLDAAQVPYAPVRPLDDAVSLPQVQARNMVIEATNGLKTVGSPIKLTGASLAQPTPPPRLGQHSDEILGTIGYTAHEIARLREAGVI